MEDLFQTVFSSRIVIYADRKRYWDLFVYLFAIAGAGLLFTGNIAIGTMSCIGSFLSFLKSVRYEFGNRKRSELTLAISNGDLHYIRYLLQGGCDPDAMDGYGDTPLVAAAKSNGKSQIETIELLLQFGANPLTDGRRTALESAMGAYNRLGGNRSDDSAAVARYRNTILRLLAAEDPN